MSGNRGSRYHSRRHSRRHGAVVTGLVAALLACGGVAGASTASADAGTPGSMSGRLPDPAPWSGFPSVGSVTLMAPLGAGPAPVRTTPPGTGEPADVAAWLAEADDPNSVLVVVNKQRPLNPADHVPANLDAASGVLLQADASAAFVQLAAAAADAGVPVRARSGYRSFTDQEATFQAWQRQLGDIEAQAQSARPGYSEHQTGLAVDIVTRDGACQDYGCFGETPQAAWVAEHAAEFGFLVRYQAGQDAVTGYVGEPWHLRYVGVDAAAALTASGARSIEEFLGLPPAPDY